MGLTATGIKQASFGCDKQAPASLQMEANFGAINAVRLPRTTTGTIRNVDPLIVTLRGLEASARVEFINLSEDPSFNTANAKVLPMSTERADLGNGFTVAYADDEAKGLSISPGDVIALRQVDKAGNASEWTTVAIDLRRHQDVEWSFLDAFEPRTTALTVRPEQGLEYRFTTYADGRDPGLFAEKLSLEPKSDASARLFGSRAIEPWSTVEVLNTRTQESVTGAVSEVGELDMDIAAVAGDVLNINVVDHSGKRLSMGLVTLDGDCPTSPAQQA